jgi:hypothetical protein
MRVSLSLLLLCFAGPVAAQVDPLLAPRTKGSRDRARHGL